MKIINLQTCDRQILTDFGIKYEDQTIGRMSASNLVDNWTETHAVLDESTLPKGSLVLKCGAFWGEGACAIKDGRVVKDVFNGACPWWDDSIAEKLVIPEDGEKLVEYSMSMNSFSFAYEEDPTESSSWLANAGAYLDAAEAKAKEEANRKAAARARYEAAKERCEFLYPIVAPKVFEAHIPWALEEGVADAAKALAQWRIAPSIVRGWNHFKRSLRRQFFQTYGFGNKAMNGLADLETKCSKISCPRLGSAIEIAKILMED